MAFPRHRSATPLQDNCVEAAPNQTNAYVRDTKDRDRGILAVCPEAWSPARSVPEGSALPSSLWCCCPRGVDPRWIADRRGLLPSLWGRGS
ncbi:DUF397 domain-containing protein [Streptomyces sp. L2]|uniref:DUF397 domain-containing protein n=1 Tax=Streptomyces sp. L2 TaxID=2162665 RepID=UPI001012C080|nr:DUF397 domain-containing protein [Streptomyces sp. L2]